MRPLIIPASRLLPGLTLYPHINETNSETLPPKSAFLGQCISAGMTDSQMLWKVESNGGSIFKVVLVLKKVLWTFSISMAYNVISYQKSAYCRLNFDAINLPQS